MTTPSQPSGSNGLSGKSGRGHWGSRFGFVLAAAGSAIGLGNIWKFPYITGENGGGWFVLIYLICIAAVGLPIMMAEIFLGRNAQSSPVGAYRKFSRPGSPWLLGGWLGVLTAFVILSYYSVVAGWAMHYVWLSITEGFSGKTPEDITKLFVDGVYKNTSVNLIWHVIFMVLTTGIVSAGIKGGIERCSKILMPTLFIMMLALLFQATRMEGFGRALDFVFGTHAEKLTPASVLEALGHAFFTLSLGMGAMITYGSYLKKDDDLIATSITVTVLDTLIALMACMVLFPITFTYGMEPAKSVGLVFMNMPVALGQMPGGAIWAVVFFVLLTFAALTSAISLLEVAASYFIDEKKWSRKTASIFCGGVILLFGIPSALSGGTKIFGERFQSLTSYLKVNGGEGFNWFDFWDYVASNWMLPMGGLTIALFVAWRVGGQAREQGFKSGTKFGSLYWGWVLLLRFLVPIGVIAVFLHAIGVTKMIGLVD